MINIAVSGCQGRMGQSIIRLALEDKAFALSALLEHKDHPKVNETIHNLKMEAAIDMAAADPLSGIVAIRTMS